MKRIAFILSIIIILAFAVFAGVKTIGIYSGKRNSPDSQAIEMTPPRDDVLSLSMGFYHIILKLYDLNNGMNSNILYIAVDMTEVMEAERPSLEKLLGQWASGLGCELLLNNRDGLIASGYIGDPQVDMETAYFHNGILFYFENVSYDDETLCVTATKYRGPFAVYGANFTTRLTESHWVVDEPTMFFIA